MSHATLEDPVLAAPVRISKHELRTRETRELLLRAAETIFIRDGYEGAELGEIAALAGRTKGAIYGHFKSKEDIFLALIRDQRARYRRRMEELLAESTSTQGNLDALRQFHRELVSDEGWALLLLEFKLFSIRHPIPTQRIKEFFSETTGQESRYTAMLGDPPEVEGQPKLTRTLAVHTIGPLLSALLLEAKVNPDLMGSEQVSLLLERLFDALLGAQQP